MSLQLTAESAERRCRSDAGRQCIPGSVGRHRESIEGQIERRVIKGAGGRRDWKDKWGTKSSSSEFSRHSKSNDIAQIKKFYCFTLFLKLTLSENLILNLFYHSLFRSVGLISWLQTRYRICFLIGFMHWRRHARCLGACAPQSGKCIISLISELFDA